MSTWNESETIHFGKRLAVARKKLGLNQTELANWAGVGRPTLSRYERGEAVPTADFLAAIASRLEPFNVSLQWLLYGDVRDETERPAVRVNNFGSLVGLRFTNGGVGEVSLGPSDLRRLLKVCIDQEKDQSQPNPKVLKSLKVVIEHFYEHHDDFEILADVPIAVHGVKLTPVVPMSTSEHDLFNWSAAHGMNPQERPDPELSEEPAPKTTQTFHGKVGQVGGGDINNFGDKGK
jgi:transcriptional regulator with XRE-family HTH domain